ncbi:hypothetical protein [Corynebacterium freiburgense]|uniref:hypothetical protein n=1 Tax=Corynebacterium freiburgense TaxID=556548 RepID=UPI0012EC81A9|nr:hypothetical protein [Corynebacterium freiburgense]WJZ01434.1 hypothetical protein CFREI_00620 [Corynebacterium freiburgense]
MSNDPMQGIRENIENATSHVEGMVNDFTRGASGSSDSAPQAQTPEPAAPAEAPEATAAQEAPQSMPATGESGPGPAAPNNAAMGNLPTDNSSYSKDEVVLDDANDVQNHVSSRDVDGDGSIDVVHSIVDGGQRISYLDDQGEVILTDVDADHDGTFETAVITTEDNVIVAGTDTDNDGDFDTITYADGRTGAVFQEDTLVDGAVASSRMDLDNDGLTDIELIDENLDGHFEKAGADTNMDGKADVVYRDINGDNTFDYASYDSDGDGIMDTNLDANDFGASGMGDVSGFEAMGHTDDLGMDPSAGI